MEIGPVFALFSAALFGISPALVKLVVGEIHPVLLAGLLYLGSGIGLGAVLFLRRQNPLRELHALTGSQKLKLLGAVVTGGILAPVFLVYGVSRASAFEASLLLNLETVTTTLFAWLFFHEHIGRRVWLSKILLLIGAGALTIAPATGMTFSLSGMLLLAACTLWGLDNNLTRDVEALSPVTLAAIKGLAAGTFNCMLALLLGHRPYSAGPTAVSLGIGMISYGASLVLFIAALRAIGSSRTSTYFASGPFFGMIFAVIAVGERPPTAHWIAAAIMALGILALYRETHAHMHTHEPITHRHRHVHDEHHQHTHDGTEDAEPHDHEHTHELLTHSHVHWPDIHHRHGH